MTNSELTRNTHGLLSLQLSTATIFHTDVRNIYFASKKIPSLRNSKRIYRTAATVSASYQCRYLLHRLSRNEGGGVRDMVAAPVHSAARDSRDSVTRDAARSSCRTWSSWYKQGIFAQALI